MGRFCEIFNQFIHKPENVFISLVIPFGILSACLVPQLSVSDENMHYLRAYGISTGRVESGNDCTLPKDVTDRAGAVYQGNYSSDYSKPINRSNLETNKCGSASGYFPILHLPQAIGIGIANIFNGSTGLTILFGRITNLLFYALAVFFIIKWVRVGKWVFVAVGLFPLMVHMAASLSGDATTNVAVFVVAATTLNLFTQKARLSKRQVMTLFGIAAMLALTKSVNVLLFLPLIFLPKRLFTANKGRLIPFNVQKWAILVGLGLTAIVCILLWQKIYGAPLISVDGSIENPLHSDPLKFLAVLFNTYISPTIGYTDVVLRGTIGEFSSFQYHLPLFVLLASFGLFFLSLMKEDQQAQKLLGKHTGKLALLNFATVTLFVAAVSYLMFSVWAILPFRFGPGAYYADGVQGRYFTALAVLLIPVGLWLQRHIRIETKNDKVFNIIMFFGLFLVLAFYIFATFWKYK